MDDSFPVGWFVEINDRGLRQGWGLALEQDESRVLVRLDRDPEEPMWFPLDAIIQGSRPPWLKQQQQHEAPR